MALTMRDDYSVAFPFAALAFACLAATFAPRFLFRSGASAALLFISGLFAIVCASVLLRRRGCIDDDAVVFLMGAAAFLLHAAFILAMPVEARWQHDFGGQYGHMDYIMGIARDGLSSLSGSSGLGQYYHPPLSHIVSAIWYRMNLFLGLNETRAIENLQILPLFYTGATAILSWALFRELKLRGWAMYTAFAAVALHPATTIYASFVNNDPQLFFFMASALLFTARWHANPDHKNIIMAAFSVGLAMLSKSSGVLLAPAVAVVFISKFISERKLRRALLQQFALFLLISLPMCASWQLFSHFAYGLPIGYVPQGIGGKYYIGNFSAPERFFGLNMKALTSVFVTWTKEDHNMLLSLCKTEVFDEYTFAEHGTGLFAVAALLLLCSALFMALAVFCCASVPRRRKEPDFALRAMCSACFFTFIIMYCKFCLNWPNIYTQNFRYIAGSLPAAGAAIGIWTRDHPSRMAPSVITAALCLAGMVFYTAFISFGL